MSKRLSKKQLERRLLEIRFELGKLFDNWRLLEQEKVYVLEMLAAIKKLGGKR